MQSLVAKMTDRLSRSLRNAGPPVPYSANTGGLDFSGSSTGDVAQRAFDAYGSVGTLFAIVSQIGNAFASTAWHLYRKGPARDTERRKEVTESAILTLWNMPNQFYTGRLFRETVQQHLDLVGEGFIVLYTIGGLPIEMWPVRPDRMKPVKHPTKYLTGWIYEGPNGEQVPLDLDQVIQIRMPNPADPYRGMGPVQSVLADIDAARFSAEWNRNFFINGARPGGIIEVDYRMSDNEWKDFQQRWRDQHRGVANAHRVAVLENAKWVDTKFSMSDMQFVDLRNLPRELIREAFAFPKPMLGTVDDVNRANSDAAKEIMAENITIPRLDRWKDTVNARLVPRFQSGRQLELDYENPVPENHEAVDRQRTSQANGASVLVKAGYDPVDVAEAMGLPEMKWVGIPKGAGTTKESNEDSEGANKDKNALP